MLQTNTSPTSRYTRPAQRAVPIEQKWLSSPCPSSSTHSSFLSCTHLASASRPCPNPLLFRPQPSPCSIPTVLSPLLLPVRCPAPIQPVISRRLPKSALHLFLYPSQPSPSHPLLRATPSHSRPMHILLRSPFRPSHPDHFSLLPCSHTHRLPVSRCQSWQ
jgi:hypothetical protein